MSSLDALPSVPILIGVPVAVIGILSTFSPPAAHFLAKIYKATRAVVHMVLSSEGKVQSDIKKFRDPSLLFAAKGVVLEKREVVFIRHGESAWNEIFNKGKVVERLLKLPFRFLMAVIQEALNSWSPHSLFLDSPLSPDGVAQVQALRKYVGEEEKKGDTPEAQKYLRILRAQEGKTVFVTSNLRRAIETIGVALWEVLQRKKSPVLLLSDLQEISRNVDTFSLSDPKGLPPLPAFPSYVADPSLSLASTFQAKENEGQKAIFESASARLNRFASWCFEGEDSKDGAAIVAAGHSLWFKTFFKAYMGREVQHKAKSSKIVNAGCVGFTLYRGKVEGGDGGYIYFVDHDSITPIYLGFA